MTQIKMVCTKVCITPDASTCIGYEYYAFNTEANTYHKLYSTLSSEEPKNRTFHDIEAKKLFESLIKAVRETSCKLAEKDYSQHSLENVNNNRRQRSF